MDWNVIIGGGGLLIAALTLLLNGKKDTKSDAMELARVQVMLTTISNGIESMRVEIGKQRDTVSGNTREITRLNEAFASMIRRMDRIEEEHKLHTM